MTLAVIIVKATLVPIPALGVLRDLNGFPEDYALFFIVNAFGNRLIVSICSSF
jgi:hypothetical protein